MKPNPKLIPRLDVYFGLDDLRFMLHESAEDAFAVEQQVQTLWPGMHPLFLDSGRTALFVALRALGLSSESRVGIPLYTCEAVFQAVARAGCRPVFLDIDPDTLTLSPADLARQSDRLDAVVPIHTFGHPADMDAVTETMGDRPIVEDCAHAVGSRHRDRPVGSLAQASFFSFRPGKPLSVGNLGMILCRDENTFDRARAIADSLPHYSHARRTWNALSAFGRSALYRRPWFGLVSLPVGTMVDERLDLMEKQGFSPHRASAGSLAVLSARFEKLGTMVERARRISAALRAAVPATGAKPLVEAPWAFHSYYQFAIRFPSSQVRERARERLSSQGVDSIKFYHDSPRIAERYGYEPGSCPASEAAANTVLAVPCHAHLTKTEVDCILHALLSLGDSS